jgi:hypothetical protein
VLHVALSNGAEYAPDALTHTVSYDGTLLLEKAHSCNTLCTYVWRDASQAAAANAFDTEIRNPSLQEAIRVLQAPPQENTVSVTVSLDSDLGAEHVNTTLTMRVRSERGILKF